MMISCDLHDHIEIVCLFRYPIRLTLKSGEMIDGIAQDTARNEGAEECIRIDVNGAERLLVLDHLATLEVRVANPHFQTVCFDKG